MGSSSVVHSEENMEIFTTYVRDIYAALTALFMNIL